MASKRNSAETPEPKRIKLTGFSVEVPESVLISYLASVAGIDGTGMRISDAEAGTECVLFELYVAE